MSSLSGDSIINSEDMYNDIQAEHMIYQINSSSDARKVTNKMKKSIEEIEDAIKNAKEMAYAKKIATAKLKLGLSKKRDRIEGLQEEHTQIKKQIETLANKVASLESETNQIQMAIETIRNAGQNINKKYLEQSQNDLKESLVKITVQLEKTQSEFNATKKLESITSKKLYDAESDFNKSESNTIDEINDTERMILNVSTTIDHIVKSYNEIGIVSKDLLKSAISIKREFQETDSQNTSQNQLQEEQGNNGILA